MVSHSDEAHRLAYVPKDRTDELSSQHRGWAPLVNILLFSLYHFFTPWQNLGRILAFTPLFYGVWWKKNIYLGMIVHCAGNLVSGVMMLAMVLNAA